MDVQITINATPKEARAELARFLDSGEYAQTNGTLCRIDKDGVPAYCCLGVASEIGAALGLVESVTTEEIPGVNWRGYKDPISGDVEEATFGPTLKKFFGMTQTGCYRLAGRNGELTNDNDHNGKTFAEIAVIVRSAEFFEQRQRAYG